MVTSRGINFHAAEFIMEQRMTNMLHQAVQLQYIFLTKVSILLEGSHGLDSHGYHSQLLPITLASFCVVDRNGGLQICSSGRGLTFTLARVLGPVVTTARVCVIAKGLSSPCPKILAVVCSHRLLLPVCVQTHISATPRDTPPRQPLDTRMGRALRGHVDHFTL